MLARLEFTEIPPSVYVLWGVRVPQRVASASLVKGGALSPFDAATCHLYACLSSLRGLCTKHASLFLVDAAALLLRCAASLRQQRAARGSSSDSSNNITVAALPRRLSALAAARVCTLLRASAWRAAVEWPLLQRCAENVKWRSVNLNCSGAAAGGGGLLRLVRAHSGNRAVYLYQGCRERCCLSAAASGAARAPRWEAALSCSSCWLWPVTVLMFQSWARCRVTCVRQWGPRAAVGGALLRHVEIDDVCCATWRQ
ncbi:hypothetical protein JKP88DRAFT_250223 [Tribonema minus]|uniref:Uncharacterized protein n=1 Tax=Tribonema minus TaxID=303371 RepID=A0A836C843_9STRA|nr:hypothetical protein JKP88DRAFT_250223 [Tribonema minus]